MPDARGVGQYGVSSRVPLAAGTSLSDAPLTAVFPLSDVLFMQPEDNDTDVARNRPQITYAVFRHEK